MPARTIPSDMYKFNKRDANEQSIIDALERAGCLCHRVVREPFDLVVARNGCAYLLEVKNGSAPLKSSQKLFREIWGWHGVYYIVRSPEEALRAVGVLT